MAEDSTTPRMNGASGQLRIDFQRYTLLVAATGMKGSPNYSIAFGEVGTNLGVRPEDPNQVTDVLVWDVGPISCNAIAEITHPAAFALIPRTTKTIRFIVRKVAASNCAARAAVYSDKPK